MIRCFTIPMPGRPLLLMVTSSRWGFSLGWGMRPKPGSVKLYNLGAVSDPLPGLEFQEIRQHGGAVYEHHGPHVTMSDGWHNLDQPTPKITVEDMAEVLTGHEYEFTGEERDQLLEANLQTIRRMRRMRDQCPACTCHRQYICDDSVAHDDQCPVYVWLDNVRDFELHKTHCGQGRECNCKSLAQCPYNYTVREANKAAANRMLRNEGLIPEHPNFETLMTPEMAEREIKRQEAIAAGDRDLPLQDATPDLTEPEFQALRKRVFDGVGMRDETWDGLDRRFTCANCDRPYVEHVVGQIGSPFWCPDADAAYKTTWKEKPRG